MAQRYVWGKWNKVKGVVSNGTTSSMSSYGQRYFFMFYGDKYTVDLNASSRNFKIVGNQGFYIDAALSSIKGTMPGGQWFTVENGDETYHPNQYGSSYLFKTVRSTTFSGEYPGTNVFYCNLSSAVERYTVSNIKGSTSYGNVSSASSGAYPENSYSGNYWYVLQGNDCIDPSAVSYSTPAPKGGEMIDVTVTPGTNTYGGAVSYKYEYSLDGSTWTVANSGTTGTTVSILIPAGSTQFQARVTASDDMGFTSPDAVSGEVLTVINNTAPVITCATSALGEIAAPFNVAYSVSDADGNTMTITEKIDGAVIRSYATTGGEGTLTIDADRLLRTLNGAHTLTITADDGNGGVTTHSITFVKAVYTATITRAEPMDADDRIAIMVMHVVGSIPADADYKVEVTNNALDASPIWEDVTSYIKNNNIKNYSFANTTCTSGTWAFNFRVTVSRGSSGVGGYITSLDGAFEGSVA